MFMVGGVGENNLFDTQRYKGKVYISRLFDNIIPKNFNQKLAINKNGDDPSLCNIIMVFKDC